MIQMDTWNRQQQKIVKNFYSIKHYWIMFLPSPFPKRWLQNVCCPTWAMTKKPGLCKLRSERKFIDFSLQCKIRAWGLMHEKEKDVLRQIQELFCQESALENFLWAVILDLHHKQPNRHSSLRATRWLLSLGRDSQLLVDTSWHRVNLNTVLLCQQVLRWWVLALALRHNVYLL